MKGLPPASGAEILLCPGEPAPLPQRPSLYRPLGAGIAGAELGLTLHLL